MGEDSGASSGGEIMEKEERVGNAADVKKI
jgi:hypothetical protein